MAELSTLSPLPSPEEAAIAKISSRELSAYLQTAADTQNIDIVDKSGEVHPVKVPVSALRLLIDVLTELGEGNAVSLIPVHAELTTQQAADMLNMSRPSFIKLLESGDISFHRVGTRRKVRYQDVLEYKQHIDAQRKQALNELSELDQELGLGYE